MNELEEKRNVEGRSLFWFALVDLAVASREKSKKRRGKTEMARACYQEEGGDGKV